MEVPIASFFFYVYITGMPVKPPEWMVRHLNRQQVIALEAPPPPPPAAPSDGSDGEWLPPTKPQKSEINLVHVILDVVHFNFMVAFLLLL